MYLIYQQWMEDIDLTPTDIAVAKSGHGKGKALTEEQKIAMAKAAWGIRAQGRTREVKKRKK